MVRLGAPVDGVVLFPRYSLSKMSSRNKVKTHTDMTFIPKSKNNVIFPNRWLSLTGLYRK